MTEFLSLDDADQIAEESAPVARPGLVHVFTGILRDPAQTLSDGLAHPIQSYAAILAAAGGVYWSLNLAIAEAGGGALPLPAILLAILALGIPAGIGYLFALTILLDWSCDILGGKATRKKMRTALAYVGVPGIVALVLFGIPKLLIFGHSLFLPERAWLSASPVLVWGLWFGDAICFAWSAMLIVKALKLMNGFSTQRAVMAAVLPMGPIALIGLLFLTIVWSGLVSTPPAF